ncbi:MAG: TolB family protein [Gemmatimonadaceae bacterium]
MSSVFRPCVPASPWLAVATTLLLCATSVTANAQRTLPAPSSAPTQRPTKPRRVAPSLGIFQGTTDVGRPSAIGAGAIRYDPRARTYEVTGGGANMWGTADHFRYVWLKLSGDVALEAGVRFTDSQPDSGEAQPHRKACLMIRQTLDSSAAYADAALHADGLTSLQWRDAPGAATHEIQSAAIGPTRLRIEKRGDYVSMYVAEGAEPLRPAGGAAKVALGASFYVGLAVSAHDTTRLETATFSDLRVERLAPLAAASAVISTIETISLRSKDRRVAVVETQPAPAFGVWWYPDSSRTLYYHGSTGALTRVQADLPGRPASPSRRSAPQRVSAGLASCADCATADTGRRWSIQEEDAAHANPVLLLSWIEATSGAFVAGNADPELGIIARWSRDGSALSFSSLKDNQIYVVRARSREPIRITSRGRNADPVFSPDGRHIYFSSDRSGRWQLWRMNLDGSASEQLTRDDLDNTHPYLSPDGQSVAFLSFDAATSSRAALRDARLRLLTLADGRIEELAKLIGGNSSLAAYPWSPDGQYLAYVSYQRVAR